MPDRRKACLLPAVLFAAMLTGAVFAQESPQPGGAIGELRVGERTVPLKFAAALATDDIEGMRLSGTPKKALLLDLSDVELPANAVGNWARLADLAREEKARVVELQIDPATGKLFGGAVYYRIAAGEPPNLSLTIQGDAGGFQLQELKVGPDELSGTALMTEPSDWPRFGENAPKTTFQYHAAFRARVRRQPPVTAVLTGAPAKDHGAVKGLLAFYAACRKGDADALRKLLTPAASRGLDQQVQQVGLEAFRKSLRQLAPPATDALKGLVRVVVRGDRATIVFRRGGGMEAQSLLKQNARWLVDAP